ncbi:hypothetical protein OJAV_G00077230 [Oryzias javanicus]|uniref:Peptidase S1 domain-containing protein n=1 Tax=Oryzias javanicus TaxID=123683 RepID=A0A437D3C3_ORYJA|nr:hypothetical protein OJAV_G00077230 [Oryzias javanicus]
MLKMALQQFVSRFTLMTLLLCSGCHPVVTDNSTLVENVSPGISPWMVYFPINFRCSGSLITNEWVLTDGNCLNRDFTFLFVGVVRPEPNGIILHFSSAFCNIENEDRNSSGICLLKLSDPVTFSKRIQAIPLASNMSTFDNSISSWVSVNDFIDIKLNISIQREVEASILGNNQCNCEQNRTNITEKEMCARAGGSYPCQHIPGSPLVVRVGSQFVLAGVATSPPSTCGDPGVFTRVSLHGNTFISYHYYWHDCCHSYYT